MNRRIAYRIAVALLCFSCLSVAVIAMATTGLGSQAEATPSPSVSFPTITVDISIATTSTAAQHGSSPTTTKPPTSTQTSTATTTEAPTTTTEAPTTTTEDSTTTTEASTTTTDAPTTTTTVAAIGGGLSGGGKAGIAVAALVVLGAGGGLTFWRLKAGSGGTPDGSPGMIEEVVGHLDDLNEQMSPGDSAEFIEPRETAPLAAPPEPLAPGGAEPLSGMSHTIRPVELQIEGGVPETDIDSVVDDLGGPVELV